MCVELVSPGVGGEVGRGGTSWGIGDEAEKHGAVQADRPVW